MNSALCRLILQFSPWSGTSISGAVIRMNLVSKSMKTKLKKMLLLRFRGYLGGIESDSQSVCTCKYEVLCHGQCFRFSSPNLEWLTSFVLKNLCPLLRLAQLVLLNNYSVEADALQGKHMQESMRLNPIRKGKETTVRWQATWRVDRPLVFCDQKNIISSLWSIVSTVL